MPCPVKTEMDDPLDLGDPLDLDGIFPPIEITPVSSSPPGQVLPPIKIEGEAAIEVTPVSSSPPGNYFIGLYHIISIFFRSGAPSH